MASTAGSEGPEWSARAEGWAEVWAAMADPAREAILDALSVGADLSEEEVRRRVASAAAPFRRDDGSYRFENRFRWIVAEV